tara:strand:- start:156 stop:620 length:465 start_codon:yes stop_codon:yes gene_type:complete
MRQLYKNFITKEDVEKLLKNVSKSHMSVKNAFNNSSDKTFVEFFINKIIKHLKKDFKFKIKKQSYFHIEETRPTGHGWHVDTGTSNHMAWCEIGLSIILKEGEGGGETYYADNQNGINKTKSTRKIYDLIAHTSDQWHMVEPSLNGRFVFLMFV